MDAGTILAYLAQSAIFYAIGYLFYKVFMAKCKQPTLNRLALIAIYTGSLIAPLSLPKHNETKIGSPEANEINRNLMSDSSSEQSETVDADYSSELSLSDFSAAAMEHSDHEIELPATGEADIQRAPIIGATTIKTIICISAAGTLFAVFLLIFDLGKIMMLKHFGKERRIGRLKIFLVNSHNFPPFSFLNWMFLSSDDANESEEMIIAHEMGHIRHLHWIDLMIMRICATLMWWNPIIWLLGRELRTVHEFQADADVLSCGHDLSDYQILLLRKAAAYNMSPMASHFAQSRLKKRFIMMRRANAGKLATLRILALGAAFFAAVFIIGTQPVQAAIERLRDVSFDEFIAFDPIENEESDLRYSNINEITSDTLSIMPVLTDESPSEATISSATTVDTAETSSDREQTLTVYDEDCGTTYTYTYRDGNLVNREVRSGNSSSNSSSTSSSQSFSSSYSVSGMNTSRYINDLESDITAIIIDQSEFPESTDFTDLSNLQNLSGLYQIKSIGDLDLSELSDLKELEFDQSELKDIASNVHTHTNNDGYEVIIINGKDTTFIRNEIPTSTVRQQELVRQQTKAKETRQKALKEAQEQRAKAEKERQKALKEAQEQRAKAETERQKALKEAQEQRAKAETERQKALKEAQEQMAKAKKEQQQAFKEAQEQMAKAQKEQQHALKEAQEQMAKAQKEQQQALKEAQEQIAKAQKEQQQALKEAQKQIEVTHKQTTIEGFVSKTSNKLNNGVTSFNNFDSKTSITVQIAGMEDLTVQSIRVRYNGEWHNVRQWNCNTNVSPPEATTEINITGPFSSKFNLDDIVEITTAKHGKIIYKIHA